MHDVAIIGGGIVGLGTGLALSERSPGIRVVIIDKEARLATHQTGHNSGVIHSGIYYKPGSFKARLCVEGARLLREFCDEHRVRYETCGKVIVATAPAELPRLATLLERGVANGVPGVRLIEPAELKEIEPHAAGIRAIHSPSTAIVDFVEVAAAMEGLLRRRGVEFRTGCRITRIIRDDDRVRLGSADDEIAARQVINCGGLYSDTIARLMGAETAVRIIPFRGEYYMIRPERRYLVRGLIYPVPDPEFPFLGVHFTRTVHGEVEAGPNAVLAFAREGYTRSRIRPAELMATLTYSGFWAMARRYWRTGTYEMYRSLSKRAFGQALKRLVPDVTADDIARGGAGVRAQAVAADGSLVDDFRIVTAPGAIHVLNAPSPAATASLAIGRHIAGLADEHFGLRPLRG
jgi:L-2-hydroxyglutarate oxidase LhgO